MAKKKNEVHLTYMIQNLNSLHAYWYKSAIHCLKNEFLFSPFLLPVLLPTFALYRYLKTNLFFHTEDYVQNTYLNNVLLEYNDF